MLSAFGFRILLKSTAVSGYHYLDLDTMAPVSLAF